VETLALGYKWSRCLNKTEIHIYEASKKFKMDLNVANDSCRILISKYFVFLAPKRQIIRVDPSRYIFKSPNFLRFCHFLAHDTKKFALRFFMTMSYLFLDFLILINMILKVLIRTDHSMSRPKSLFEYIGLLVSVQNYSMFHV
jgi:hypothetical protein